MIYAVMPVKNEASRWLTDTLAHLDSMNITVLVCDDSSEDETCEIADGFLNTVVVQRPDSVPTFLQHEGRFRQWCWESLGECFEPEESDWVLAIDADEFLVGMLDRFNPFLHTNFAFKSPTTAWSLTVAEAWGLDDDRTPLIRKDRFWALNQQIRLTQWRADTTFPDRNMASGSVPTYARDGARHTPFLTILHYGYVRPEDRQSKYERYKAHPAGHNPAHIDSIMLPPQLERWDGEVPCLQPA